MKGMTIRQIAAVERCSERTICTVLNRAVAKLIRRRIGAFPLILGAMAAETHEILRAGSLECRRDWIEIHIGVVSSRDRVQSGVTSRASCRATFAAQLSRAGNNGVDEQDGLRRDAVLSD